MVSISNDHLGMSKVYARCDDGIFSVVRSQSEQAFVGFGNRRCDNVEEHAGDQAPARSRSFFVQIDAVEGQGGSSAINVTATIF